MGKEIKVKKEKKKEAQKSMKDKKLRQMQSPEWLRGFHRRFKKNDA